MLSLTSTFLLRIPLLVPKGRGRKMSLANRDLYAVTVDCVVFSYSESGLELAVIKRGNPPFKGMWALPGGFVEGRESCEEAARRELAEETNLSLAFLEQFHTFSAPDRDPRGRVISVAFLALTNRQHHELRSDADAADVKWVKWTALPPLAFDHKVILNQGFQRLQNLVRTRPVGLHLLSKRFTLTELQNLYEAVLQTAIDKRNFRKKIHKMPFICETGEQTSGLKHRPAMRYEFDEAIYQTYRERGYYFDL